MNMLVIAEGIETSAQAEALRRLGCSAGRATSGRGRWTPSTRSNSSSGGAATPSRRAPSGRAVPQLRPSHCLPDDDAGPAPRRHRLSRLPFGPRVGEAGAQAPCRTSAVETPRKQAKGDPGALVVRCASTSTIRATSSTRCSRLPASPGRGPPCSRGASGASTRPICSGVSRPPSGSCSRWASRSTSTGRRHRADLPFDVVPRIVEAREWDTLERGLVQRVRALNLFIGDIYGPQRILEAGVVPRELVLSAASYLPPCHGLRPPRDIWCHVVGLRPRPRP